MLVRGDNGIDAMNNFIAFLIEAADRAEDEDNEMGDEAVVDGFVEVKVLQRDS